MWEVDCLYAVNSWTLWHRQVASLNSKFNYIGIGTCIVYYRIGSLIGSIFIKPIPIWEKLGLKLTDADTGDTDVSVHL